MGRVPLDSTIRAAIIADITAGALTLAEIANRYSVSRMTLWRIQKEAAVPMRAAKKIVEGGCVKGVLPAAVLAAKAQVQDDLAAGLRGLAAKAVERAEEALEQGAKPDPVAMRVALWTLERAIPSADARLVASGSEGLTDLMRTVLATPAPPDDFVAQQAEIDRRNHELADPDAPSPA